MDYVTAQYPPKFIQGLFDLTEEQINTALAYIEAHRADVEAEYQQVLKEAEELRQIMKSKIVSELPVLLRNHLSQAPRLLGKSFEWLRQSVSRKYDFFD